MTYDRAAWMKDYQRRWTLLNRYGITPEDYDRMLAAQGGVCIACGKPETRINAKTGTVQPLAVDHDHESGRVRGLLCCRCNRTLGMVDDDPEVLRRLAAYLDLRPGIYEAVVEVPAELCWTVAP